MEFLCEKIFLLFFAELKFLMFHKNIVNILEKKNERAELVEILPLSYLPYRFLHICIQFYYGKKVKIFDFLKTND